MLSADGTYYTAGLLHESCTAPSDTFGEGLCIGYIAATVRQYGKLARVQGNQTLKFGHLYEIAKLYLASHPEEHHLTANSLLRYSIRQAICP